MGTLCYEVGAAGTGTPAMPIIPLHLQRRFEQRWTSRFTQRVASNAPKNVGTKATPSARRRVGQKPKKNPPA